MLFESFEKYYPEIALVETRLATIEPKAGSLAKKYLFVDTYCNDKKCDCRRSLIQVLEFSPSATPKPMAFISYGWEPTGFYRNWAEGIPDSDIAWLKGPALDPFQPQSPTAEVFLKIFVDQLEDTNYRDRIIRHYAQFKHQVGMKLPKPLKPMLGMYQPCGCKSGKSFKLCCGKRRW